MLLPGMDKMLSNHILLVASKLAKFSAFQLTLTWRALRFVMELIISRNLTKFSLYLAKSLSATVTNSSQWGVLSKQKNSSLRWFGWPHTNDAPISQYACHLGFEVNQHKMAQLDKKHNQWHCEFWKYINIECLGVGIADMEKDIWYEYQHGYGKEFAMQNNSSRSVEHTVQFSPSVP